LLPGRRDAIYAHLNQITRIRWDQGRLGELRGVWQGIVDQFPQTGFSRGWLCLADAELGRQDDAQRWLRSLVDAIPKLSRNRIWLAALAVASVAAALLEDADSAASVHPLLLPYAERTIVMSVPHPVVCFGSASLYVALLEATMSRWDEAEDHFGSAIRAKHAPGGEIPADPRANTSTRACSAGGDGPGIGVTCSNSSVLRPPPQRPWESMAS
jgi:hypothetical protein